MVSGSHGVGRYSIESPIDRGEATKVFLARDRMLERSVALKVLRGDGHSAAERAAAARRLAREARRAAAVTHPNVVTILDAGEGEDGSVFLAMELLRGDSLRTTLSTTRSTIEQRMHWCAEAARGLGALHRAGIVHHGISSESVILTEDGAVKLLAPHLCAGTPSGSSPHSSPEQLRGEPTDGKSDQYAWGVMAYELFASRLPWPSQSHDLTQDILLGRAEALSRVAPSLDPRLVEVVTRAMATDRTMRFRSMDELLEALLCPRPSLARVLQDRSSSPSLGTISVGRYQIADKIAAGGMATVHFGRLVGEAGFSRTIAIKRLHPHLADDPSFMAAMLDEARLVARIQHPNVVPTLDVVSAEGELLIVMEYVRGESLSRLLHAQSQRNEKIPIGVVSGVILGVLHGLHAAHEATSEQGENLGIVHRDISPQNVLVGVDGVARVIDFGVAKAGVRLQKLTREGSIKGKVPYMPPEQLSGGPLTRATDIYAVGVVLWESLTCRRLFNGSNDMATLALVQRGATEPPSRYAPDIPPALDALVMRALAPSPDYRFSTALEMANELLRVVPPAFPTVVGAWCAEVASEALAKRASQVGQLESRSSVDDLSPPFDPPRGRASDPGLVSANGPFGFSPASGVTAVSGLTSVSGGSASGTRVSTLGVEIPPVPSPRASDTTFRILVASGSLAAVIAIAVFAWVVHAAPRPPAAEAVAAKQTASAIPTSPTLSPQPVVSDTAPTMPVHVEPGEVASRAAPPPAVAAAPSADAVPRTRPKPPRGSGRPASCSPPFTIDDNGYRVYKPACL